MHQLRVNLRDVELYVKCGVCQAAAADKKLKILTAMN